MHIEAKKNHKTKTTYRKELRVMSEITKDDVVKFIEGMTVLELSQLVLGAKSL